MEDKNWSDIYYNIGYNSYLVKHTSNAEPCGGAGESALGESRLAVNSSRANASFIASTWGRLGSISGISSLGAPSPTLLRASPCDALLSPSCIAADERKAALASAG